MNVHELKCWPTSFWPISDGSKTGDLRFTGDRLFKEGDLILMREWRPDSYYSKVDLKDLAEENLRPTLGYTGNTCLVQVTDVYAGVPVPANFVLLSIQRVKLVVPEALRDLP